MSIKRKHTRQTVSSSRVWGAVLPTAEMHLLAVCCVVTGILKRSRNYWHHLINVHMNTHFCRHVFASACKMLMDQRRMRRLPVTCKTQTCTLTETWYLRLLTTPLPWRLTSRRLSAGTRWRRGPGT